VSVKIGEGVRDVCSVRQGIGRSGGKIRGEYGSERGDLMREGGKHGEREEGGTGKRGGRRRKGRRGVGTSRVMRESNGSEGGEVRRGNGHGRISGMCVGN